MRTITIDGADICSGDGRTFNHSCCPNCIVDMSVSIYDDVTRSGPSTLSVDGTPGVEETVKSAVVFIRQHKEAKYDIVVVLS